MFFFVPDLRRIIRQGEISQLFFRKREEINRFGKCSKTRYEMLTHSRESLQSDQSHEASRFVGGRHKVIEPRRMVCLMKKEHGSLSLTSESKLLTEYCGVHTFDNLNLGEVAAGMSDNRVENQPNDVTNEDLLVTEITKIVLPNSLGREGTEAVTKTDFPSKEGWVTVTTNKRRQSIPPGRYDPAT